MSAPVQELAALAQVPRVPVPQVAVPAERPLVPVLDVVDGERDACDRNVHFRSQ